MATIALYSNYVNQMPTLIKEVKNAVVDYRTELSALKKQVLTISNSICNMSEVITSIQAATQTQEQKLESIDILDKNNEEFISDVIATDSAVSEVIRQRKDDFYATYSYLRPECEKSWLELLGDGLATVDAFCREHWKEIVTVLLVVVAVVVIICCPGVALLFAMAKGILIGAAVGGLFGGAFSAWRGGSFWDGFWDGAFMGAVSGMLAAGMGYALVGGGAKTVEIVLTLKQTLLVGGVTGALTPAISDIGDIIIKGEDISLGQVIQDVVIGGVLGVAFAGIGYGISKAWRALKLRFGGNEGGSGTSWYKPDGSINYPPNNGAVPGTEVNMTLKPGDTIGRYGNIGQSSNFVTQTGADASKLALPPNTDPAIYQEFLVIKEIPNTIQAEIASWGGSAGGGLQYELPMPILQLIKEGYIVPK